MWCFINWIIRLFSIRNSPPLFLPPLPPPPPPPPLILSTQGCLFVKNRPSTCPTAPSIQHPHSGRIFPCLFPPSFWKMNWKMKIRERGWRGGEDRGGDFLPSFSSCTFFNGIGWPSGCTCPSLSFSTVSVSLSPTSILERERERERERSERNSRVFVLSFLLLSLLFIPLSGPSSTSVIQVNKNLHKKNRRRRRRRRRKKKKNDNNKKLDEEN